MSVTILPNANGIGRRVNDNTYPRSPITEMITNGFFTVDHQWMVKSWNKAAEKLLGVPGKDIVGRNLWEQFAGIIPLKFYTVYHLAFLEDIPVHFEEYWEEKGAWFDVITYYCNDVLSVSFKRSDQHGQAAQQLKMLNQLYRFVTEVTNDCLWEWDFLARELFWIDGGHKRVFGYQIENALIPQSFWENRLHPEDKERVLARLHTIMTEGSASLWEEEYRFRKANGHYAYVYDRGHIIYDDGEHASRMIGATQDITARVRLENTLVKERVTRQKEITNAVLTAQETERADLGRELHDNLNQILGAAKMYVEMAKTDEENREMCLDKASSYILHVIEDIRRISKTLATPGMVMGLCDSIENLLEDLMRVLPIEIAFNGNDIDEKELDEKVQLDIFRIVQEQFNNIVKHANASEATIHLSREGKEIILLITDNGAGCDLSKENKGVGIINIKSRAELYQGNVTIHSNPGEGFQLRVVLQYG